MEEINRGEMMVMVMMVEGPEWCDRCAGKMERSKGPEHEGDVLCVWMYFNPINVAICHNNYRGKDV